MALTRRAFIGGAGVLALTIAARGGMKGKPGKGPPSPSATPSPSPSPVSGYPAFYDEVYP